MLKRCPSGSRKGMPPSDHLCFNNNYPHAEVARPIIPVKTLKVTSKRCKNGTYKGDVLRGQNPQVCYHKDTNLEVTPVNKSQDILQKSASLYKSQDHTLQNSASLYDTPIRNTVLILSIAVISLRILIS